MIRRAVALIGATAVSALMYPSLVRAAPLTPDDLTVEGRLYDNAGLPINQTVDFKLEVLEEGSSCVLYRESRPSVDLSSTDLETRGVFSLRLGAGAQEFNGQSFAKLFAPGPLAGDGCSVVATAATHRRVRVSVRYNAGVGAFEALGPDTSVTAVPLSKVAENALTLEGMGTASFLVLNGTSALRQSNLETLFTTDGFAKLMALVAGTSNQYQVTNSTVPYDVNSQRITNLANPTGNQDAATKAYADTTIGGRSTDLTGVGPMVGDGLTLLWDSTANKWKTGVPDRSPTGAAGGDLTGTYPNPTIADDKISARKVSSTNMGVNRLVITDAVSGTNLTYVTCMALNQVLAWTATGWQCTAVSALSPVASVAGKTGVVTLNAGDIGGLGTAALYDVGTGANGIPQLDASARLPAVDGRALTNVDAFTLRSRAVASTLPSPNQYLVWNGSQWEPTTVTLTNGTVTRVGAGTGLVGGPFTTTGTLSVDVGTAAGKIVQLNGSAQLPALDGSLLTQINAVQLQTRPVSATAPTSNQVLAFNATGNQWEPKTIAVGSVVNVSAGSGLLGGNITTNGTLSVDVGVAANKIVQLNTSAQLPAIDGSLLTQINAVRIQSRTVATTAPTTGQVLSYNTTSLQWEPTSPTTGTVVSVGGGTGLIGGPVTTNGTLSVDVGVTANKIVQLNTSAQLPAIDGSLLTQINAVKIQTRAVATTLPTAGQVLVYNTTLSQWEPASPATGTVVSVTGGTGLTGGPVTTNGTLSVDVGITGSKIPQLVAGQLRLSDGSLAAPTYGFNSSNTTGMFSPAANSLGFATGGVSRVYINPAGLVGVNTTSPSAVLDLVANTNSTSGILIPRGPDTGKPAALSGMIRFNTDRNVFETAQNNAWKDLVASAPVGIAGEIQFASATATFTSATGLRYAPATGLTLDANIPLTASGTSSFNALVKQSITPSNSNTIDCSVGNLITSTNTCASPITLNNFVNGATYTIIMTDTGTSACTFGVSGGNTVRYLPPSDVRVANSHTIYSVLVALPNLYVSWTTGF